MKLFKASHMDTLILLIWTEIQQESSTINVKLVIQKL